MLACEQDNANPISAHSLHLLGKAQFVKTTTSALEMSFVLMASALVEEQPVPRPMDPQLAQRILVPVVSVDRKSDEGYR